MHFAAACTAAEATRLLLHPAFALLQAGWDRACKKARGQTEVYPGLHERLRWLFSPRLAPVSGKEPSKGGAGPWLVRPYVPLSSSVCWRAQADRVARSRTGAVEPRLACACDGAKPSAEGGEPSCPLLCCKQQQSWCMHLQGLRGLLGPRAQALHCCCVPLQLALSVQRVGQCPLCLGCLPVSSAPQSPLLVLTYRVVSTLQLQKEHLSAVVSYLADHGEQPLRQAGHGWVPLLQLAAMPKSTLSWLGAYVTCAGW